MNHRNTPHQETSPQPAGAQPLNTDIEEDEGLEDVSDVRSVENESDLRLGGDTGFDRVVDAAEAGLGGGLDQAEEAQLGITDEQLEEMARRRETQK